MAYAGPIWHYGKRGRVPKRLIAKKQQRLRIPCFIESFNLQAFRKQSQNGTSVTFTNLPWTQDGLSFFGGQGSRLLYSGRPSVCFPNNGSGSNVSLLMSACHAAFLQEVLRSRSHGPVPPWAQFRPPAQPEALLTIPTEYCDNPIFQGVSLCVSQLRTYLASDPDLVMHTQSVAGGFCSGMLPAVVLASSTTIDDFIQHSTEAVRLAY